MPAFAGMTLLCLIEIPTRAVTPAKAGVPFVREFNANDYSLSKGREIERLSRNFTSKRCIYELFGR
jgi:hypothetical protein